MNDRQPTAKGIRDMASILCAHCEGDPNAKNCTCPPAPTAIPNFNEASLVESPPRLRVSWDRYFLDIAKQAATRATCDRAHVGCVIVRDRTILATGYNGSIRGAPHCDDAGHIMEDGHCVATVHAEANALVQAAKMGARVDGATVYVTHSPCWPCFKLLANAGVATIIYDEAYRPNPRIEAHAKLIGIRLHKAP